MLRAFAADQIVSDPGDNGGANQLRAKLTAAASSGGGTITFTTGPATVLLNGVLPLVTNNITIDGGNVVGISGNNAFEIFFVNPGGTLNLRNLTISHAYNSSIDGGAVQNYGTLNISNCKFLANQTSANYSGGAIVSYGLLNITNSEFGANMGGNGGAIYPRFPAAVTTIVGSDFHDNTTLNTDSGWGGAMLLWDGAPVTLIRDTFQNNSALYGGGAVYVQGSARLTVSGSQFTGNQGQSVFSQGGAIYSEGTVSVLGCTFVQNHSGDGGALAVQAGTNTVAHDSFVHNWAYFGGGFDQFGGNSTVSDCLFTGNGYGATNDLICDEGGGIEVDGDVLTLNRVTISSNYSKLGGGMYIYSGTNTLQNVTLSGNLAGVGGAIDVNYGVTGLTNITICQNTSTNGAGALYLYQPSEQPPQTLMTVRNILLASNTGGNSDAAFGSGTFSLSDDGTGDFGAGHDYVTNLLLGPLANNGGAAPTCLPLPGSAAIDAATSLGAPLVDQRGYLRAGAAPDVGAVESGGQPMKITSISRLNAAQALLQGRGLANISLNVEVAPGPESLDFNFLGATSTDASGLWQYTDLSATSLTNRYYRAVFQY